MSLSKYEIGGLLAYALAQGRVAPGLVAASNETGEETEVRHDLAYVSLFTDKDKYTNKEGEK